MIVLEVGNSDGLLALIVSIMIVPPVILAIIGFCIKKNYPKTATALFILAVVYLIAGLGICGGAFS